MSARPTLSTASKPTQRGYAPTPPSQIDPYGGRADYLGVVVAYDLPATYPDRPGTGVHSFKWARNAVGREDYFERAIWSIAGDKLESVKMARGSRSMYICEFYCTYAEARDITLRAAAQAWAKGSECAEACEAAGLENCPGVMRKRRIQARRAQRLAS